MKRALLFRLSAVLLGAAALQAEQPQGQECRDLVEHGRRAYESRRFETAIGDFTSAVNVCGQRTEIHLALGEAQLMAGRLNASIESLRQAIRIEPKNVLAQKVLGDALYLAGKEPEAEESLKAALALDLKFEPALYALGRIYYQQNRFPEAVDQFQRIIELDAKNYRAYDNLGLCYEALHRDAEALRYFLKALDLVYKDHPEYDLAHADLADFFLKQNQYDKAFQLAAEAAQRNPNSARDFFLTGKALAALNRDQLSLRWLERAVELDASYREAHYLLARTYQKLGRKGDADQEFAKFRELNGKPVTRR